jgi:hypothetical protein
MSYMNQMRIFVVEMNFIIPASHFRFLLMKSKKNALHTVIVKVRKKSFRMVLLSTALRFFFFLSTCCLRIDDTCR